MGPGAKLKSCHHLHKASAFDKYILFILCMCTILMTDRKSIKAEDWGWELPGVHIHYKELMNDCSTQSAWL